MQVSDFGLSRVVDVMSGSASPDKHGIGALTHAAPELLTGMPLTTACDVYSVGVLLWELVTGKVGKVEEKSALPVISCNKCTSKEVRIICSTLRDLADRVLPSMFYLYIWAPHSTFMS
jgi:hypothetical protein